MKLRFALLALLGLAPHVFAQAQPPPPVAFVNVHVLTMEDDRVQPGMTVVVSGDRIVYVGAREQAPISEGVTVVDGTGKYLLPGLAEMHGHVPPPGSGSQASQYTEDVLFLYLAGGITTVRGMLGYADQLQLRERVQSGELLGPTLYLAGPSFNANSVNSPAEASDKVRQQKAEGWDLLKIHPGLTLEEYTAMAQTAQEAGIAFAGHVPEEVGLENAIRLGQQTIDHLDGYMAFAGGLNAPASEEKLAEAVALTKAHDVWVVPTQALWETLIGAADADELRRFEEIKYMPKSVVRSWENYLGNMESSYLFSGRFARLHAENRHKLLKALQDADVRILMGTDAPQVYSVPGFSIHRELASMQEAGLSPYQILRSGTYNVGQYFADKDQFGTVVVGSRADRLLVPGNPLEDIGILRNLDGVMVRGKWFPKQEIDARLAEIEARHRD